MNGINRAFYIAVAIEAGSFDAGGIIAEVTFVCFDEVNHAIYETLV